MLRVMLDAFCGVGNPSSVVDDAEAAQLLRDVSRRTEVAIDTQAGFDGLGFRGRYPYFRGDSSTCLTRANRIR